MCAHVSALLRALPRQHSYQIQVIVVAWLLMCVSSPVILAQASSAVQFPDLFNVALNRPISTTPSAAVCGVQTVDGYCASSWSWSSVSSCQLRVCSQSCPYRSSTPPFVDLIAPPTPATACSSADYVNIRPGATVGSSASTLFVATAGKQISCYLTPSTVPALGDRGSFTLSFWVWPNSTSLGFVMSFDALVSVSMICVSMVDTL